MKLTKEQKKSAARELGRKLQKAPALYFTQYQGLKFVELQQLRSKLKPVSGRYQVLKNSIIAHALREAGIAGAAESLIHGPVGLVVSEGTDPVAAAKALATFAREFPFLKIRAGYVDGQWLDAQACMRLSAVGTRPELLSALAGALYSAAAQAAMVLQAPLRDLALVLKAVQEKKGGEAPAAA